MKHKMILLVILLLLGHSYLQAQYGPVVSFTYDDGFSSWYYIGFPVFQEYGFPGVVYINATNAWVSGNVNKLLEMQAAGWEISNHTYSHNCSYGESEVSTMKDWLDVNGFPNSGFGAPCNTWDHSRANIVNRYHPYIAGSYTNDGGISKPFDLYYLQRHALVNQESIEQVRAYLDDAVVNNKWIIFSAHEFGGTYGDGSNWSQSDSLLRLTFNEIVARGIPVKTVREVITDLFPPGCVIECSRDTMQYPVLTYFEQQGQGGEPPVFNTSVWNEYWHNTFYTGPRFVGSPVVYYHTSNDSLPAMKFYHNVPDGVYDVSASIILKNPGSTYRLYYSFDSVNTSQYNVEVNKNSDVSLGTVTVTNGQFAVYTQNADVVSGSDGDVGWAFIKLFAKPLLVNLKVFLEGPYNGSGMTTTLHSQGLMPKYQPFKAAPWNYLGTEAAATFPTNAVDWVIIELRSDLTTIVSRRAGLLLSDGSVVDIDGSGPVKFKDVSDGNYYVVVRHRNHLPIMSANPVSLNSTNSLLYDFSTSQSQAFGTNAIKDLGGGYFGMIGGDTNSDGFIDILDFVGPDNEIFFDGYRNSDSNMDGFIDIIDFILPDNNNFLGTTVP